MAIKVLPGVLTSKVLVELTVGNYDMETMTLDQLADKCREEIFKNAAQRLLKDAKNA